MLGFSQYVSLHEIEERLCELQLDQGRFIRGPEAKLSESPNRHDPVLLSEVLEQSQSTETDLGRPLVHILDLTFGRGGHSRALLQQHASAQLVASDQDPKAIETAKALAASAEFSDRIAVVNRSFADWVDANGRFKAVPDQPGSQHLHRTQFDFILMDLGVSSPQLDDPTRGFSFYHDGPLDMRMNPLKGRTAAEVLQEIELSELIRVFKELGDVPFPDKVARRIVESRDREPIRTTLQLSNLIERVDGWRQKGFHPATLYFMALRMYVNRELDDLRTVLPAALDALTEGGRLAVISFHSHEDRMVKSLFRKIDDGRGTPVEIKAGDRTVLFQGESARRKSIQPTEDEVRLNPRARSAKLRVMRRLKPGQTVRGKNKYAHLAGGAT